MTTCLDDLNATLQALVAAVAGDDETGVPNISISLKSSATASASAVAQQYTSVQVQAIAAASANALAILDIDLEVNLSQTTTITNLTLPPVSPTIPPNITVFPETDTGVSDTPRDSETASGTVCQAIYYVIDSLAGFTNFLAKFPQIGYLSASALSYVLIPALQAAEFYLATKGIILSKAAIATLQAFLMGLAAANEAVGDQLSNTAFWLVDKRDEIAGVIYCAYQAGASSLDVQEMLVSFASFALSEPASQYIGLIFSTNVLGAILYDSLIFDASDVTDTCDGLCGE